MTFKRFIIQNIICVAFLSMVMGCASIYNPATGKTEYIYISTDSEVEMGKDVHQELLKQFKFVDSGRDLERLRRIGQKVAAVSDRQDYTYQFYLVDEDQINAFTTPGGNIYFFAGLFHKLNTDDAIASVLAHEIGHCAARHVVKKYQAALGYNLIGSIVLSQVGGDAQQLASAGTGAIMDLVFKAYGRQDEFESDRLGIKYMILSGYNPEGMIATFEVLKKASDGDNIPLMLRSHPYVDDRIAQVKREIAVQTK